MDVSGTLALGNGSAGITIDFGAKSNTVDSNVISGNSIGGVHIERVGTDSNVVTGNFIGTDVSGTLALGNGSAGLAIVGGAKFIRPPNEYLW